MYVDASNAIHDNKRSHTGSLIPIGTGIIRGKLSRQQLNVKSSTEGVSNYRPYTLWTYNFMKAQGYNIENNMLYQDNMSAIKIEKNGRLSCTGNS